MPRLDSPAVDPVPLRSLAGGPADDDESWPLGWESALPHLTPLFEGPSAEHVGFAPQAPLR